MNIGLGQGCWAYKTLVTPKQMPPSLGQDSVILVRDYFWYEMTYLVMHVVQFAGTYQMHSVAFLLFWSSFPSSSRQLF